MKIEPTLKSMILEDDIDPVNKPVHYTRLVLNALRLSKL